MHVCMYACMYVTVYYVEVYVYVFVNVYVCTYVRASSSILAKTSLSEVSEKGGQDRVTGGGSQWSLPLQCD